MGGAGMCGRDTLVRPEAEVDQRYDTAIRVVPYDPDWPELYAREAAALRAVLPPEARIEHIGSTSVAGLAAKPVVDIVVMLPSLADGSFRVGLAALGYAGGGSLPGVPDEFPFFGKPAPRPRQFHVHVCATDNEVAGADLAVRDFLRAHGAEAAAYGALKTVLATERPGDRLAYMNGKDVYVRDLKRRATAWARGRAIAGPAPGIVLAPFAESHVEAVMALCAAEGWSSYAANAEVTMKALTTPSGAAVVAVTDGRVVGLGFGHGDGFVQGYLSLLVVHPGYRRQGLGRALVQEVLRRLGVARLDLLSSEAGEAFYLGLPHRRLAGFRLYHGGP